MKIQSHILFSGILLLLFNTPAFTSISDSASKINPQNETPALVVGIIVDQMRYDYLFRYWEKYSDDGFKRLLRDGFSFNNAQFDYMPTYTAPGHASIFTGTTPSVHGIIGNTWYLRDEGRSTYVTADPRAITIGAITTSGQMSPRWLQTSTIGDELRLHTNLQSKVIAVSLKDRSAIMSAGHIGDAYWLDSETGDFITSSHYKEDLPDWVLDFNMRFLVDDYLSSAWETLHPIEEYTESILDDNPYEGSFFAQKSPVFPHHLPELVRNYGPGLIISTPFGDELLLEFALSAIEGESLGRNKTPDFLAISFSSPDHIGHQFGPASIEIQDTYLRLDRQITRLLNFLDEQFGKENILLFLTSDHGAGHVPGYLNDLGLPAGNFGNNDIYESVSNYLNITYGENLITNFSNQQIFLDRKRIAEMDIDLKSIQEDVALFMLNVEGVAGALSAHSLQFNQFSDGIPGKIQKGYHPKRSGDVIIWLQPQWMPGSQTGTTHGSPYSYNTRAPLLWYGWNIEAGHTSKPVYISDIASTLALFLNTPFPTGNTGNPMNYLINK